MMNEREYVRKGFEAKIYVYGGPGTGKTESVIQRVEFLKNTEGLSIFSEILILSFTRAAVHELQKRFNRLIELQSMAMNICTFDEFCARLNKSLLPPESRFIPKKYEDNIQMGIENLEILLENEESQSALEETVLANTNHIIVDEVQDLNGSRAELVSKIFKVLDSTGRRWGFTLLGDLDQEIYSYTQNEEPYSDKRIFPRSKHFISWIFDKYVEKSLEVFPLPLDIDNNPRFCDLNSNVKDYILKFNEILKNLGNYVDRQNLKSEVSQIIKQQNKKTIAFDTELNQLMQEIRNMINNQGPQTQVAFLFRSNELAYHFSLALFTLGIEHRILLENLDKIIPPWIARLDFKPESNYCLRRNEFLSLRNGLSNTNFEERFNISIEEAWKILCLLLYNDEDQEEIDLNILYKKFSRRINETILFDNGLNTSNIIISTIHKSKGREYDYVYMCEFDLDKLKNQKRSLDLLEEIRVKYVAMTRCKKNFFLFDYGREEYRDEYRRTRSRLYNPKNLVKKRFHGATPLWWTRSRNIVKMSSFVDYDLEISIQRQDYIWNQIKLGDDVKLIIENRGGGNDIIGRIFHNEMEIGGIQKYYAKKIINYTQKRKRFTIPDGRHYRFEYIGLKVVAITAEMISPYDDEEELKQYISGEYIALKFWLGVRITGPIYLKT